MSRAGGLCRPCRYAHPHAVQGTGWRACSWQRSADVHRQQDPGCCSALPREACHAARPSGPARTSRAAPLPIHPSPPRSKLALSVKLTLDQVLGFALWHGALAAIYEPHRQACLSLVQPQARAAQQAAPAAGKAAAKKKGK